MIKQLPSELQSRVRQNEFEKELMRVVYYMDSRDYIARTGKNAEATLEICPKGIEKLDQLSFTELLLRNDEKWDGMWRILTYDIPEEERSARDAVRRLVKELGMKQLQKSVWITPLPCAEEVKAIKDAYGVHKHISFIETYNFDRADEFKRYFIRKIK